MKFKLPLCSLALCAMFGVTACGDSSSSSSDPAELSSDAGSLSSSSGLSAASGVRLPAGANINYPTALYPVWKAAHYTTLEEEAAKYPTLGAEFSDVFGPYLAQGLNAARIIWSNYTAYAGCTIAEASGTSMYRRGCTVSEGIGYGMLVTLFAGDWDAFNRLWVYSKAFRASAYASGHGLMPWLTTSFSWDIGDKASATDADIDIATSLVLAYYTTGTAAYLEDALSLIASLWTYEVNKSSFLLYSGDTPMWTGENPVYNLSYFSPVAIRLFALVDPNHDWNSVLTAQYAYMQKVQAAGTGVFPDWSDESGVAANPDNNSADKTYWTFNKESVRIPWRLAWDYYWFQDSRAAAILNTLNAFISTKSGGDPAGIPAVNYSWNLAAGADIAITKVPTQWLGAWCLTGMAGADAWMDACANIFNAEQMQTSASSYFSNMLQMMMSQLMNGAYIKPALLGI